MKKILILAFLLLSLGTYAQREVPQSRMEQIYEEAKTPYKYGLAVAPADNKHKIDCPTVFREGDKWYMTYVVYNGKSGTQRPVCPGQTDIQRLVHRFISGLCTRGGRNHHGGCAYPENGRRVCHVLLLGF